MTMIRSIFRSRRNRPAVVLGPRPRRATAPPDGIRAWERTGEPPHVKFWHHDIFPYMRPRRYRRERLAIEAGKIPLFLKAA
jgi:hypothetical protein